VPFIELAASPLAPETSPVCIHYRDNGAGAPLVVLHGGWGYEVYPFDRQIAALARRSRVVVPDRSGYGRSTRIGELPADFHRRAMEETLLVLERLGIERPVLWGHSDGAIIALLLALARPDALSAAIVEATHLYKRKPASRAFFDGVIADPQSIGEGAAAALARDHGAAWRDVVVRHSRAWRAIADGAAAAAEDFYDGRLGEVRVPVLVVHGARDPRTEPGELDALRRMLAGPAEAVVRQAQDGPARSRRAGRHDPQESGMASAFGRTSHEFAILPNGGHSPHSERATADEVTALAEQFIRRVCG
jgi:pimeloyl-ACP methyl ester carboxylesterase